MKKVCFVLCLLALLCACDERTVPASTVTATMEQQMQTEIEMDLSPLTKNSLGEALLSSIEEVKCVTVTDSESGELVYESKDDMLSQSFYDALQIVHEETEKVEEKLYNYNISFAMQLGFEKSYQMKVEPQQNGHVTVQKGEKTWLLPETESDWIRARLSGLA